MSIGHQLQNITVHFYQPSARFGHCTIVLGNKLYLWGGKQELMPAVHSSKEKSQITSCVEVFHLLGGHWEQFPTTGQPPLAVFGYSCTSVTDSLYYFGGYCNHGNCYHNSLHRLEVISLHWNQLLPSNPAQSPMRKWQCGMAHVDNEGEACLVVVGGYGLPPSNCRHAHFVEGLFDTSKGSSNEVHAFSLTQSCWYCPEVVGDAPPPSNSFSLTKIGPDKLAFFGGYIPAEMSRGNFTYILHFTRKMVHWQKMMASGKLGKKHPVGRCDHAGTSFSISSPTRGTQTSFFMLSLGGIDDAKKTLSECWILDLSENQWRQLFLPDEVSQRLWHSVSVYPLNSECVLMLVFGGRTALMKPAIADTYVVELVRNYSGQWAVEEVLDTSTLASTDHYKSILARHMQDNKSPLSALPSSPLNMAALGGGDQSYRMLQLVQDYHERATDAEKKAEEMRSQRDAAEVRAVQQEDMIQRLQAQLALLQTGKAQQHQEPKEKQPHWLVLREEVKLTDEVLGAGAWGEVRAAWFRGLRVAAKFLHGVIISSYSIGLFTREMNIAAQLHHPNLIQFLGASKDEEPMILLELMSTCLRKELEKNDLTRVQISSIAEGVACGLNYLHCWKPHPIVHRDISSANVLLEPSGRHGWKAKLSDFGSANFVHQLKTAAPGNPCYASPEAIDPTQHSTKMDIYSFGVLLAEMCIRELPSIDPTDREHQIVRVTWSHMHEIILVCTAQQPLDRPSAIWLVDQLQALMMTQ